MRGLEKKKRRRTAPKNRLQNHKRSVVMVSMITVVLSVVVFTGGMSLKARNDEYKARESELRTMIEEETARSAEIDELKEYVGTDEYIESVAKEKLGLVHKDEILFKEE